MARIKVFSDMKREWNPGIAVDATHGRDSGDDRDT